MTLVLLLVGQLAAATRTADSTYSSPALARFVATAAASNRTPPERLRQYRARVESELSLLLRDTLGRERVAQIEQIAMSAEWERRQRQRYDLRVVGYRSQSVGVPYSALSFARSWTIPYLYGDRLTLGVEMANMSDRDSVARSNSRAPPRSVAEDSAAKRRRPPGQRLRAVHPLATDRDRFYRFSGGDTVAQLRAHGRTIPIVRVSVTPSFDSATRASPIGAFEGEIDFDATRHQIVRMRGQFVASPSASRRRTSPLARMPGLVAVAFVEFVNAEVDGEFWLPAFQRAEFQAGFSPLGPVRSIFRLVSRFADVRVDTAGVPFASLASTEDSAGTIASRDTVGADTATSYRRRLFFAPTDSVSRYDNWLQPIGSATGSVSASDFDDLVPDVWRATGRPRVDFMPTKFDDVFRFNRVEGAYTGAAATVRFRDAAPGFTARLYGGWAWREETARGGATLGLRRDAWTTTARVERQLASTNDFALPLEGSGIGFAALLGGVDNHDYVDRRVATIGIAHTIRSTETAILAVDVGIGEDRSEVARLQHGLIGAGSAFRFNRGVTEGRYARSMVTLEIHPDVTGVFLQPGMGAIVTYEVARGDLAWERAEVTLSARRSWGRTTLAGRAQGGVLRASTPPPQTLFELGGEGTLPGYAYKEFAGDRAGMGGLLASYAFPVWRRPVRLVRSLVIPGLGPGVAIGVQGGWTEVSSAGAHAALQRLDPTFDAACDSAEPTACPSPISRATDGIRATVDARVTLFGGLVGVGVARPVDHAAPWRLAFRFGQEF